MMIRKLLKQAPKRQALLKPKVNKQYLNNIIPRAYENLQFACFRFIQGIQIKDYQFLQSVMSPYLFNVFKSDFEKIQNQQLDIKVKDIKSIQKQNLNNQNQLSIHPYVLFGGDIKRRLENVDRFFQIGVNRYMRIKRQDQNLMSYLKQIRQNHIYGFECLLIVNKQYEIEPQQNENQSNQEVEKVTKGHQFLINIQTDSQKDDYYIIDLQNQIKNNHNE